MRVMRVIAPGRSGRAAAVTVAATILAVAAAVGLPGVAGARVRADRVLVLSYPRLTWDLVDEVRPPVLMDLLGRAAVASMSVQSAADQTDPADGYLSLGAGNRARAPGDGAAGAGPADEGGAVVVADVGALQRANDGRRYGTRVGAMGAGLVAGGRRPAVVANADLATGPAGPELHREAALAMIDTSGRAGGSVAPALAVADPAAPGGRRVDAAAVLATFADVWEPGAAVLVEMSDLDRADRAGTGADLAEALRRADSVLERLLAAVTASDLVLVVAPAAPGDAAALTAFAMSGAGVPTGQARSATTRRAGYVTLPDVAPTVLHALGASVPDAMNGTEITAVAGDRVDPASLAERDARSRFRERAAVPVSVAFLALQLVVYGAAALAFRVRAARPFLLVGLFAVLAFPALTFASGATSYDSLGLAGYVGALVAGSLLIGAVVAGAVHGFGAGRSWWGAWGLVALTWVLLVVDAVRGGALQLDTPFGYSPITAARFAGMGNVGFALVLVSALVVAAGAWLASLHGELTPDPPPERAPRRVLVVAAAVFAVTVVVDGLPALGADLGGVLALVPALAVGWLVLAGRRVTWPRLLLLGAAAVVAAVVVAAVDLARPEDDRTHVGRFAQRVLDGEAGTIMARKVATNLEVLLHPGVVLVVALGAAAAVAAWRSAGFAEVRSRVPGVGAVVLGAAVGGVLGFGVNDSGVVVPGMMLAVLAPWFTCLAFDVLPPSARERPAAGVALGREASR